MDPKLLTESQWKAATAKSRVKGQDLQKALAEYDKLEDDKHDALLEVLAEIKKNALALKKSKEAAADSALVKYITDLISAAESKQRDVARDKAQAEKAQAQAEKRHTEQENEQEDEDGNEEEGEEEFGKALLSAFQRLKGAKDAVFEFIVCEGKPHCAVMLAKKISPKHKATLTEITGSKRFLHMGLCRMENGRYKFEMEQPVAGLAKKLQDAIKHHAGKKLPIVVGNESVEAEEEPRQNAMDPNLPGDPAPFEIPPPLQSGKATLEKAPEVWHHTRGVMTAQIRQLKAAVIKAYAADHPEIVSDIEKHIQKLDRIVENLNQELADVMAKAHAARDAVARKNELTRAKNILAGYIKYVKTEPMIAQIDSNPFGVKIEMRKLLTERLTHMAQAIG